MSGERTAWWIANGAEDLRVDPGHEPAPATAGLVCPGCGTLVPNVDLLGWIEPSVYDGILIWVDERCGHRWPRFAPGDNRHDKASALIALADVVPGGPS